MTAAWVRVLTTRRVPRWTPRQAVAWAAAEHRTGSPEWVNKCERFAAGRAWGYFGSGWASAIAHWHGLPAGMRHTGAPATAPRGSVGYFAVGRYGHAVLMDGDGWCWSTDIRRRGRVDRVPVAEITKRWGARWLGWTQPEVSRAYGTNPDPAPRA